MNDQTRTVRSVTWGSAFASVAIGLVTALAAPPVAAGGPAHPVVNATPIVTIHSAGNRMFYWPDVAIAYQVVVSDAEDGDTLAGSIDPHRVAVAFERIDNARGSFIPPAIDSNLLERIGPGKELIARSNCPLCHAVEGERPIPTYKSLADMYKGRDVLTDVLAKKIIEGASGTWIKDGTTLMPPHPEISLEQARAMARYILAQEKPVGRQDWLPLRGIVTPRADESDVLNPPPQHYVLWASYTDGGIGGKDRKTSYAVLNLRAPELTIAERAVSDGVEELTSIDDRVFLAGVQPRGLIEFPGIDLTDVREIALVVSDFALDWAGGRIELRTDDPLSRPIGQAVFQPKSTVPVLTEIPIAISAIPGQHDLYVYLRGLKGAKKGSIALTSLKLRH